MRKIMLNWTTSEEITGGCEVIFDNLKKNIGGEIVTSTELMTAYGFKRTAEYYRYAITDRVQFIRDFINDIAFLDLEEKVYIANDCCCPFGTEGSKLITYTQNPYYDVADSGVRI